MWKPLHSWDQEEYLLALIRGVRTCEICPKVEASERKEGWVEGARGTGKPLSQTQGGFALQNRKRFS
jgi:hypothetical protein